MGSMAPACHPAAGRAQGCASQWEVADILRLYGQTYCATHPVPPPHQKVMHDIM